VNAAHVDPAGITATLGRLSETRSALRARSAREIAEALGRVGERLGDPEDALAREAVAAVTRESGLSPEMTRRVVGGMARDWTRDRLSELLAREFTDPAVLDGFVEDPRGGRRLHAVGDPVAVHVGSGSVPGVSATSMIRSLMVKTPVLIKPGRGDRALTEAFHRGLEAAAPQLAASAAVRYWPASDRSSLEAALSGAARVVVYGSDSVAREIQALVPPHLPTVVYHHRLSVAVVGAGACSPGERVAALDALAWAACTFDQRGCVSPHRVFLLGIGPDQARELGAALAESMEREARAAPAGERGSGVVAGLQQRRAEVRMRAAVDPTVAVWSSPDASWTVLLDPEAWGSVEGHPRTLTLVPVADPTALFERLRPLRAHLQSVGLAGVEEPEELSEGLAELGVTRIVPLEELPFPPAWWMHDGAGPLKVLSRWVEWTP
jgi:hypothetical protein